MHPRDDTPAADLDLGDLVMRVARDLRRTGMTAYEPYDLAPHHARALRVVAHHGTMRLGELAQHLRVAPRSVTDVVDALEDRRLVRRSPDPTDRRAQVVGLTEEGRRLVDEVDAARRTGAEAYFGRLPERDRASLRRILERLDEQAGD
ncbi:MarR family winged helix-turn-helix transcriptional regulator [Phycicoccus sp. HDW14]|uniref:MarR family winged helix-turn-helix transcriptional regulator n=1 Tax=Phycicoccus sp. HDW14 TaxID=2714941 RepID=UPI001F0EEC16|nr:MarR family transcriptional regulator [Phycicoccus sp. HDW14]